MLALPQRRRYTYLHLFDLHQKSLELRSECIRIDHRWSQLIGKSLCGPAFVLRDAAESPMNRDANLERLFAVDFHGTDAARDHGLGNVMAARARNFDSFSAANAHAVG